MNQQLQEQCELFVANKEAIQKKFRWEDAGMIAACSILFAKEGVLADGDILAQCKAIVKKETGVLSNFQSAVELVLISKMALSGAPEKYLMNVKNIYDRLKKNKVSGSEYSVVTAMLIADQAETVDPDEIAVKIKSLYAQMKKEHPFLTGSEDITFAALLAMSGLSEDVVLKEMEECYPILKNTFSSSNAVQSLSHILALDTKDVQTKCEEVVTLYHMLKQQGKKYDSTALPILGGLSILEIDKEALVSDIVEVDAYLKKQKGFGILGIGEKQRLLFATSLVMNRYAAGEQTTQVTMLTSSVAIVISEQLAMLAAISAASAAASSSN